MTRIYAICTREAWLSSLQHFHPQHGSRFIELPNGKLLVLANFMDEAGEAGFSLHPDVELLPDIDFQGNSDLKDAHLDAVAHLQLEGKTVLHLARAAGKIHPLMKLRAWL